MTTCKVPLLCSFLLLAITALQAKTYSGRVVDDETGIGLSGVAVTLLTSDGKATTDQDGQFSLTGEASVTADRFRAYGETLLHWRSAAQTFDLSAAPLVKSIALFSLKGERLYFKKRTPGADMLPLPGLPESIYLMHISTRDGRHFSTTWAHLGNNVSFSFGSKTVGSLSKRVGLISYLEFKKQGYQTKQMDVDGDKVYDAMLVTLKPEIGYRIFDDDTVRTYRLYLTTDDKARLLDYGNLVPKSYTVNTVVVPARLTFEGRTLDSVGVRFRGDQSLWDCVANGKRKKDVKYPQFGFGNGDICAKFTMKFDFNKYNKDQRLLSLKALNFRSMSADPTKMHEKLGHALFNDMGIASPRVAYAKLFVNDTLWGLFGVTEEVDGRFTKSRYPTTGDGNLYKEIWPGQESDASILEGLSTNNDPEDNPDISDFKEFCDVVSAPGTDSGNFLEKMKTIVDIPHLVRYIAVDRGIMNFDGIMSDYGGSYGHHNYFWYHDDSSGLFKLIPWDLDKALLYPEPNFWTNNAPVGTNLVPNWNVVNKTYTTYKCVFDPGSSGGSYNVASIDKDKFLRLLRGATWNDFRSQGQFFLDSLFNEQKLTPRINKWRSTIAGAVGEDPTIDSTEWAAMVDSLVRTIPLFRTNLKMMIDTLIVR